jgi:hypothetical protein
VNQENELLNSRANQGAQHMSRKTMGIIAIAAGIVLFAISFLADYVGLGIHPYIYYGWKQISGMVVAILLVIGGLVVAFLLPQQS